MTAEQILTAKEIETVINNYDVAVDVMDDDFVCVYIVSNTLVSYTKKFQGQNAAQKAAEYVNKTTAN